ncbi:hypothetical protein [Streptomyces sp. NPDC001978]
MCSGSTHERGDRDRHRHSSDRDTVEHALVGHKRWKQLAYLFPFRKSCPHMLEFGTQFLHSHRRSLLTALEHGPHRRHSRPPRNPGNKTLLSLPLEAKLALCPDHDLSRVARALADAEDRECTRYAFTAEPADI